jgi:hypothetical protein
MPVESTPAGLAEAGEEPEAPPTSLRLVNDLDSSGRVKEGIGAGEMRAPLKP